MINGNAYAWEDVRVLLDGTTVPLVGIIAIDYTAEKNHFNIHGAGADPVELGRGVKTYSGSLTLLQSAVEAMQATILAGKDITDLVYNITVAYAPAGAASKTDRLLAVRFTSVPKGLGTQNPTMEINLPMVIGKINYNV